MKKLLDGTVFYCFARVFMAVSVGFCLFSAPVWADMPPPPPQAAPPPLPVMRSITVQGQAHGEFDPDQAVLSFSVVSRDKELAVAKKNNDQIMQKLLGVTQKFDIPKEKVVSSGVYISPEYRYTKQNQQQTVGYTVNRSMRITTKDLSRQEELLSALVEVKIDQVNNVEFQLAEPEKYATQVKTKAFENAKAEALALAEAAGAKLGAALIINTAGTMDMPRPPMPMMAMARGAMEADSASVAPSMPGAITLTETVNVTFALE